MMRLMVGLMAVGLLAMATPASAQFLGQTGLIPGGKGDPLTLASSGVLVPYFNGGAAGDLTFLEIVTPVGPDGIGQAPGLSSSSPLHMIFFDSACVRFQSQDVPMSINDLSVTDTSTITGTQKGLIAIGIRGVDAVSLTPIPTNGAIHTRAYWLRAATNRSRVLEPIIIAQAEDPINGPNLGAGSSIGGTWWSPLRSAATFLAIETTGVPAIHTPLIFICPTATIQGFDNVLVLPQGGVFPTSAFWPVRTSPSSSGNITTGFGGVFFGPGNVPTAFSGGSLSGRLYDTNELLLRDVTVTCTCLTETNLPAIVSGAPPLPAGSAFYVEVSSDGRTPFTGYKSIEVTGSHVDLFSRLSGAFRNSIVDGVGLGPDGRPNPIAAPFDSR
jgi:hypothetical protein